jgi:polo-like kinase 1
MKESLRSGSLKPSVASTGIAGITSANGFKTVANGFMQSSVALQRPKTQFSARSEIYVKKWVDYSSKYGLGYLLSNGSSGVFFNDSSKIICDPKT